MDKLTKVRAEVERLHNEYRNKKGAFYLRKALRTVLFIIDSMQKEPKDRCRGCNNVKGCITCVDGSEYAHIEECNITGIKSKHAIGKLKECIDNITEEGLEEARKQLEELTKECIYSKDNYTDEDRKVLCEGCNEKCMFNKKEELVSEDLEEFINTIKLLTSNTSLLTFEYGCREGAKWQKQQDQSTIELAEDHAMLAGMEKMKEEMIDKACEYLDLHCNEVKTEDNGIAGWIDNEFIDNFRKAMKDK